MGAGASSTWEADHQDVSAEDAQAKFDAISEEERNELTTDQLHAMKGALGSKFLQAAFQVMVDAHMRQIEAAADHPEEEFPDEPPPEVVEEAKAHVKKAFKNFDKDDSGTICGDEAKCFFSALTMNMATCIKSVVSKAICTMVRGMVKEIGADAPPETVEAMKDEMKKIPDQVSAAVDRGIKEYEADKEARDEEAFKVCDSSGDGSIKLDEFLEIFTFGDKLDELAKALGVHMDTMENEESTE